MTPRVRVVPVTLEIADALLAGDDGLAARLGMRVAPGYLDFPEVLPVLREAVAAGTPPEWYSHLIVDADTDTVVGFGGFKGAPVGGEVEIGYSVAPSHQGRGYASAAVACFLAQARDRGVATVCAHTLADENASTTVLRRAGFVRTAELVDEEVGDVWRWELALRR